MAGTVESPPTCVARLDRVFPLSSKTGGSAPGYGKDCIWIPDRNPGKNILLTTNVKIVGIHIVDGSHEANCKVQNTERATEKGMSDKMIQP